MFSYHQDTEQEIQMCLHCEFKECTNCLGSKGASGRRGKLERKHEEWTNRIRELVKLGLSDVEIAARINLSPKTVLTLRHAAGIQTRRGPNKDARKTYLQNL